ncbi:C2 family cysteine protease [Luteimonas salinilitoris]|uniref:C2 family cysteine protease n=1 Tax=Luteimonas salinilitoris TaxID=3237697 RepID=A0ABV4HX95_9GAMM
MSLDQVSWAPPLRLPGADATAGEVKNPCDDGDCRPIEGETTPFAQGTGDPHAVAPNDVRQGQMNNCFLVAAMSAVAEQDPGAIEEMIRDNGDGTYTVTLHQYDKGGLFGIGSGWEEVQITVTAEFPESAAQASGDVADDAQEIWPQLIEKAYAQLTGGYGGFEAGGSPADALSALTGESADSRPPGDLGFEDLQASFEDGDAITFLAPETFEGEAAQLAQEHNVVGWHTYSVSDVFVQDGVQMVELRNPWGSGDVTLPYSEAQQIFLSISDVPRD